MTKGPHALPLLPLRVRSRCLAWAKLELARSFLRRPFMAQAEKAKISSLL